MRRPRSRAYLIRYARSLRPGLVPPPTLQRRGSIPNGTHGHASTIPLRAEARVARMRDILVLCPQERDLVAIRAAGLEDRYSVRYEGSDLDQLDIFDPVPFLEHAETLPADA